MKAIFKREWKALFQSVTGWLFLAITLGLFGLYFYVYNLRYGYPYLANTLSSIVFIQMITVPILTMRILAEERKNKTDQLLLTAPVSVGRIVFGKYLAMAAVFTIAAAIMAITPLCLQPFGKVALGESYVSLLGYWLFGLACIAIGTFVSSLTESQVISAVLTFGLLFLGYMMNGICGLISTEGNLLTTILSCYDLSGGMNNFFNGILDIQAVIYYLSLTLLFLFLSAQSIQKRRWSISSKKLKLGVFSTSFVALALAAVVAVNLVGTQLPDAVKHMDVTSQKLYSITEDTRTMLKGLKEDITIYVLSNEKSGDEMVKKTLERYQSGSEHISVVYKDPAVYPSFYTNYTDSSISEGSLIVESGKRSKVISYNDLYEIAMDYTTYSQSVTGYDAEGQLSSAIAYVTSEEMPVVYQLTGHEEQPLGSTFTDAVGKLNVTLESLNLLEVDAIPEDAAALVINAPAKDLSTDDAAKVLDYLNKGGKAVLSVGYTGTDMPNYESILAAYQVQVEDGVLMEGDRSSFYQMPYHILAKASYDAATAQVSGDYIFMPYARGLSYPAKNQEDAAEEETGESQEDAAEEDAEGDSQDTESSITYKELLSTSDNAYAKADPQQMTTYDKEEGDAEGPFVIGLHVSAPVEGAENAELYIFGSDSIFTDEVSQMVYGSNASLFAGVLSQFTGTDSASVVPVKSYDYEMLTIHQAGVLLLGLGFAILTPLVLLALGIVIWARRRRW